MDGVWTLKKAASLFQQSLKIKFLQDCLKVYAEKKNLPQFANVAPHILEVPANNLEMPTKRNKPSIKFVTESLLQTIQAHVDFPRFTDKQLREVQENMSLVEYKNHTAKFLTAC